MSIPVPNSAPPSCRNCAHVELIVVRFEGYAIPRDRCAHPSGAKPMHEGCGYRKDKDEVRK